MGIWVGQIEGVSARTLEGVALIDKENNAHQDKIRIYRFGTPKLVTVPLDSLKDCVLRNRIDLLSLLL